MTLRGASLLDNLRIRDLENVRKAQPLDVQGHFNKLPDGRMGPSNPATAIGVVKENNCHRRCQRELDALKDELSGLESVEW